MSGLCPCIDTINYISVNGRCTCTFKLVAGLILRNGGENMRKYVDKVLLRVETRVCLFETAADV